MVEQKYERAGFLGLVTVLALFGGSMYLSPIEAENTYYCSLSDEVAVFHRLSSTGKTGYYMIDGEENQLACKDGRVYESWITLRQYIEEQGLSFEDVLAKANASDANFALLWGEQGLYECKYKEDGISTYSQCYQDGVFKNYAGEIICPA